MDCYFYRETPDMGAMIPCCILKKEFGCKGTECDNYFPKDIVPERLLGFADFIIRGIVEHTMYEKEWPLYLDSLYEDIIKMTDDYFEFKNRQTE